MHPSRIGPVPSTTDSDHARWAVPNQLLGQPAPTVPNRVWVDSRHLLAQIGRWLALLGHVAGMLFTPDGGLGRARGHI